MIVKLLNSKKNIILIFFFLSLLLPFVAIHVHVVPPEPFLEAFSTGVNTTSITVGWVESGIPESDLITVSTEILRVHFDVLFMSNWRPVMRLIANVEMRFLLSVVYVIACGQSRNQYMNSS